MKIHLDFEECIKDSPSFRDSVLHSDTEMAELENQLDRMTKTCSAMIESGKTYSHVCSVFVSSLDDFSKLNKSDVFMQKALNQFSTTMSEISNFHSMLFDHAQTSVKNQLVKFLKEDVKGARDAKKSFDRAADDYSTSLSKYSSANKVKPSEIDDVNSNLANSRANFRSVSMDYVVQANMLKKKNRFQVVDKLLSYMHALSTYFHQGYELMKDQEPFLKKLSAQLEEFHGETEKDYSVMMTEQGRYSRMTGDAGIHMRHEEGRLIIEGYLFKRASNAFKTWNRRWFTIRDNKLFYQKKKDDATVVIEDVRLCTMRIYDDIERRFCFEVISPGKSFLLQADSEEAREAWISALQTSIDAAFKHTMAQPCGPAAINKPVATGTVLSRTSSASSLQENKTEESEVKVSGSFLEEGRNATLAAVSQVPGNKVCADCGKTEPRWASISLGVTLCIDCSGVHRSLGVHISKVRSLTLDQWEPEVIKIMYGLGNTRVNEIFLAKISSIDAIKPNCTIKDRQLYIKAKYGERKFVLTLPSVENLPQSDEDKPRGWVVSKQNLNRKTFQNIQNKDESGGELGGETSGAVEKCDDNKLLVFGRNRKGAESIGSDDVQDISLLRPNLLLYKAAEGANLPVMMLAMSNGASPDWNNPDERGKTSLMAAASVGSIQACEFLLLNGGKVNSSDLDGRTALHYAALHNHTGVTCQLLKRRVDVDIMDNSGKTALKIAVDDANADIVTLIRLKKMSNQMKEDDVGAFQQNDDLVNDVFRDFTRRATSSLPSPSRDDFEFNLLGATMWQYQTNAKNSPVSQESSSSRDVLALEKCSDKDSSKSTV